jgi:hypothetical protein
MITPAAGIASPFFTPACAGDPDRSSTLGPTCPRVAARAQTPAWVAHIRSRSSVRPCVGTRRRRQVGPTDRRRGTVTRGKPRWADC